MVRAGSGTLTSATALAIHAPESTEQHRDGEVRDQ